MNSQYILPKPYVGYDFRTIEEFFHLNNIDENIISSNFCSNILSTYVSSNWQWHGIQERPMIGHIRYIEQKTKENKSSLLIDILKIFLNEYLFDIDYANILNCRDSIKIILNIDNPIADNSCLFSNILLENKISNQFYNIIELFLYLIHEITIENENICIYLKPAYTEYIEYNGIGYHIVDCKKYKNITYGIGPHVTKIVIQNSYRFFPEKQQFICSNKSKSQIVEDINKYIELNHIEKYIIYMIDFSIYHIDLWKDYEYKNIEDMLYTYTYIPNEIILETYDINDII